MLMLMLAVLRMMPSMLVIVRMVVMHMMMRVVMALMMNRTISVMMIVVMVVVVVTVLRSLHTWAAHRTHVALHSYTFSISLSSESYLRCLRSPIANRSDCQSQTLARR